MKYITIIFIMAFAAQFSFADSGVKNKKYQVKKHTKITYQRLDGSIYETYVGAGRWYEVVPSSDGSAFAAMATSTGNPRFKKYYYTNADGETFSSFNMNKFKPENDKMKEKPALPETGLRTAVLHINSVTPNPADNYVTISFVLPERENVSLSLFTMQGMKTLEAPDMLMQPGMNEMELDISALPSGIYYIKLENGKDVITRRLVIVR